MGVLAVEVPVGAAGLQGDLIQQVNDQAVRNAKEFLDAVTAAPKEQALNLKIIRSQQTKTLTVKRTSTP
jgi:S1-C subfamily serine protease